MNSNNELKKDEYSITINETGPQLLNPKKTHSFFNIINKGLPKSPRRDSMPFIPIQLNKMSECINNQIPCVKINEELFKDPIKERIEQKITQNIKNREGFESLFQDPEIDKLINK